VGEPTAADMLPEYFSGARVLPEVLGPQLMALRRQCPRRRDLV
jgi:hypothetical protein